MSRTTRPRMLLPLALAALTILAGLALWRFLTTPAPVAPQPITGSFPQGDLPPLTVEDYPIVADAVEKPTAFEYMNRVGPQILARRARWRTAGPLGAEEAANAVISRFGYQLVKGGSPGLGELELRQGDRILLKGIYSPRPIQVAPVGDRFALVLEALGGDQLLTVAGLQPWDSPTHRFRPPVFAGADLVQVRVADNELTVQRGDRVVYRRPMGPEGPSDPVKGLTGWGEHWALEVDGQVIVDGDSLNQALGYEKIFAYRILAGQPLFFFRQNGQVGLSFGGQVLPQRWDEVVHYRCCEPAAFNVAGNAHMIWFHARKGGIWHYVEAGIYQ